MKHITYLIALIFYAGCATNTQTAHVDNRDHAPAVAYNFEETKETGFPFYGLIVESEVEEINYKLIYLNVGKKIAHI